MHRRLRIPGLLLLFVLASIVPARAQVLCDHLIPFGLLPPSGGFSFGCARQFSLKLGAAIGPDGNYVLINYPSCANGPCAGQTGTALLQCQAASGYFCCIQATQMIPTITGTNVGTFATGLTQRFLGDTDTRVAICYADYVGNGARVANAPVVQFIGIDRTQVQVTGFLRFFLVGLPAGTGTSTVIPVEFVSDPTPTTPSTWGRVRTLYR